MLFIKLIIDSDHMSPKTSVNDWHRCVHTTVAAYNVFLAQNKHRIFIHSPLAYCPHELITTSEGHNARKISSQEYEQSLWNELMKFYIPVTSAFFWRKKVCLLFFRYFSPFFNMKRCLQNIEFHWQRRNTNFCFDILQRMDGLFYHRIIALGDKI